MEGFLIGWILVAIGLVGGIGLYNYMAKRRGGKTLLCFPDSLWPEGEYFLGLFFIVPVMLLT